MNIFVGKISDADDATRTSKGYEISFGPRSIEVSNQEAETLMWQLANGLGYTPLKLPREGEPWEYETAAKIQFSQGWHWCVVNNANELVLGMGKPPMLVPNQHDDTGKFPLDWDWNSLKGQEVIESKMAIAYTGHPKDSLRVKGGRK